MKQKLKRGKTIELDAEGPEFTVILTLTAARSKYQRTPVAAVTDEWTGFSVTINSISLASTGRLKDGSIMDTYDIAVEWRAGGDTSGAVVDVEYPDTGDIAKAIIAMHGP